MSTKATASATPTAGEDVEAEQVSERSSNQESVVQSPVTAAASEVSTEAQPVTAAAPMIRTEVLPVVAASEYDSQTMASSSSVGFVHDSINSISMESDIGVLSDSLCLGSRLSSCTEDPNETDDSSSLTSIKMAFSNLYNFAYSPESSSTKDPSETAAIDDFSDRTFPKTKMSRDASERAVSLTSCNSSDSSETAVVSSPLTESSDGEADTRSTSGEDPVVVEQEVDSSDSNLSQEIPFLVHDFTQPAARDKDCCDGFRRGCVVYGSKLKFYTRWIRDSKGYKLFQISLLCLAIYYSIVGIKNLGKCPPQQSYPILVIIVGASFFLCTLASLLYDLMGASSRPNLRIGLYLALVVARLVFIVLFINVVVLLYAVAPTSDSRGKPQCDNDFYKAVKSLNSFIISYILISICMSIPFLNSNLNDYETV